MQASSGEIALTRDNIGCVCDEWMLELAGLRGRRISVPPGRTALIVIDPQVIFIDPHSPACLASWSAVAPNVVMLVKTFVERKLPVAITRHLDVSSVNRSTELFFPRRITRDDPLSEIAPAFTEFLPFVEVVEKSKFQAPVDRLLSVLNRCDNVVVTGVQAQLCVLATVLGLGAAGIIPVVVADGIAAPGIQDHIAALRVMAAGHACILTAEEVMAATCGGKVFHD